MGEHAGDRTTLYFVFQVDGVGKTGLTDLVINAWHTTKAGVRTPVMVDVVTGYEEIGHGAYGIEIADTLEGEYVGVAHTEDLTVDEQDIWSLQEIEAALSPAGADSLSDTYYCSYADLQAQIESLADLIPAAYIADPESWVLRIVQQAQWAYIDPVLQTLGVTTPIDPVPDTIRGVTILLAAYEILRPRYARQEPNMPDFIDGYRKDAKEILERLRKGELTLNDTGVNAAASILSTTSGREQGPFTLPQFEDEQTETTGVW
jgi:hypothetical protein